VNALDTARSCSLHIPEVSNPLRDGEDDENTTLGHLAANHYPKQTQKQTKNQTKNQKQPIGKENYCIGSVDKRTDLINESDLADGSCMRERISFTQKGVGARERGGGMGIEEGLGMNAIRGLNMHLLYHPTTPHNAPQRLVHHISRNGILGVSG
jgi:hypothetical protein